MIFSKFLRGVVMGAFIFCVVVVVILVVQFTIKVGTTDITYITLRGETYRCEHRPDEMECVSIDDPDVGFGRTE